MTATAANSSRDEKIRNFLQRQNLRAWIAWRPDELVMMTGCVPHWGASLLVYFDDVDPLLFVPPIEPREFIPPGLRVRDYPWGVLNCAEPYSFLLTAAAEELQSAGILTAVTEARRAALDVLQPGISAGEVDAAARNKVADHGFSACFTHPTGHHVGFRYHDPGFAIAPRESASLEPGMVITIEPGVYVKDHGAGARIEDNVLLTESGYEVLSRIERSNAA
jgi:Xaa-Pro aminopeptidase